MPAGPPIFAGKPGGEGLYRGIPMNASLEAQHVAPHNQVGVAAGPGIPRRAMVGICANASGRAHQDSGRSRDGLLLSDPSAHRNRFLWDGSSFFAWINRGGPPWVCKSKEGRTSAGEINAAS
jgi:hypothetical protein